LTSTGWLWMSFYWCRFHCSLSVLFLRYP